MKCPLCNGEIADGSAVCNLCGTTIAPQSSNPFSDQQPYASPPLQPHPQAVQSSGNMEDDPAIRMLIPIGRSIHAIIAGYLGLLSLACCPLGPLAVLFGILAIVDIKKNPKKGGIVRAIVGIVLGLLGSLGLVMFLISWLSGGM